MLPALTTKKIGKRACVTALLIVLFTLLLLYNSASIKVEKENKHRTILSTAIVESVNTYHRKHQYYPPTLTELHLAQQHIITDMLQAGVLEYKRDLKGTEWFTLTCRYSGILASGKKYRLSWQGIQYSNDPNQLPLPPGVNMSPDKNGFYVADFH